MLILASASKARSNLLRKGGIVHRVMTSGVDEESFEQSDPFKLVEALAFAKASAVASRVSVGSPSNEFAPLGISAVLGCDSVFVFQNQIFGKPKDSKEAIERWQRMSSNTGTLITGHALLFRSPFFKYEKKIAFDCSIQEVINTHIEFGDLTIEEIEKYVSTGEPLNCAGGFALEGKGAALINKIDGCYSNVIGLSLPWLRKALFKAGLRKI